MRDSIKNVQQFMISRNIDALVIRRKTMKKYLKTLTGGGCTVLLTQKSGYLILDNRYLAEALAQEKELKLEMIDPYEKGEKALDRIQEIVSRDHLKKVAIEGSSFSLLESRKAMALADEVIVLSDELDQLRVIKTEEEIAIIEEAIRLTDQVYHETVSSIRIGMSEYEISALLHYHALKRGAQQMAFDTIVTSGERTAMAHGRATDRVIEEHDPIMLDFGLQYKNYQSDMTRMVFVGEPHVRIKEIYETVLLAQCSAIESIRAGVMAKECDAVARNTICDRGYGEYFIHGLGHGIGIGDGSEYPILNQRSETILENHMLMSCEPGIYIPGFGGVRIEDDVLIRDGQGIALNQTSKELVIIGG